MTGELAADERAVNDPVAPAPVARMPLSGFPAILVHPALAHPRYAGFPRPCGQKKGALSGAPDVQVDVAEFDVQPHDRVLLCSDGLHGVIAPDRLSKLVHQHGSLADVCNTLIDAANEAGGPDNITVALLQIDVE